MQKLLTINLFGAPQVLYGDSRASKFPAEKVKLLFYYLVLFRHLKHPRSVLSGIFWGDSDEAQARHSLNTAMWRLRRWLESLQQGRASFLLFEEDQIGFNNASPYWLDTAEFEDGITSALQQNLSDPPLAAAALNHAVELYRGELLEGCYADWCFAERARYQQLFHQALVHLMVYYGGQREFAQAIVLAQRLLKDEPLREDIQRELMKLFMLDNQPAEALLQYHRCETALREELGIKPMRETQELFRHFVLNSAQAQTGHALTALRAAPDLSAPSTPYLQKIDEMIEHLERASEELRQGIETLRQIKSVT